MKILCIGQSAYDITLPMEKFPVENEKERVKNKVECGGGSASNCAYLLAKWGLDTYFAGIIGNDHYGKKILEEYKNANVNTKYLEISNTIPTTSSYIIANTSTGTRTILTSRKDGIEMSLKDIEDNFDMILLDGYEKEFAKQAIEKNPNAIKVLDAGSLKEATVELSYMVDYLVCSHDFAEDFSKTKIDYDNFESVVEAYNVLKKEFKNNIIITLESYGCFTCINGIYKIIPSIETKALDTTGAGDIFHGAFVYSLANNFPLEKALLFSNITGGLSVEKIGSRYSIPEISEVEKKYNDIISK